MNRIVSPLALAAAATLVAMAASAQDVPNPANPFPQEPIATDGSSLRSIWPRYGAGSRDALASQAPSAIELQALQPPSRNRSR